MFVDTKVSVSSYTAFTPSRRSGDMVVGVGDVKVTNNPDERLITYALGSCLGVAVYDPVVSVAGLLHVMLPTGSIDNSKMLECPAMFVDSGIPLLFRECYRLGAVKERMRVKVAGGAYTGSDESNDRFQIGKRNIAALKKLLWKNGVLIHAHDTGGSRISRTMWMDVMTGAVTLKVNGIETQL